MRKNYGRGWIAVLVLFLAAVYSVLLFALKSVVLISQWVAYGYTITAFILLLLDAIVPFSASKKYPMLDLPMSIMTCVYFIAQLILGGIVAMCMPNLSLTTAIVIGFVLLAGYVVVTLVLMAGSRHTMSIDEQDTKNICAIRKMKLDLDTITSIVSDTTVKQSLKVLSEKVAYSDPVSTSDLRQIEERINNNISLLREDAENGEIDQVVKRIEKISHMIDERSNLCAAGKR